MFPLDVTRGCANFLLANDEPRDITFGTGTERETDNGNAD